MSDPTAMISDQERAELAGAVGEFVYNFFRNQEPVATVAGNRRAADKAAQVVGRVIAAVAHQGNVDGSYMMLSRRYEVLFGEAMQEVSDKTIRDWIKSV